MENILYLLMIMVGILLFRSFLPEYFKRKGENLATKEDISEITYKIESVKHDYSHQLETIKAELSAQLKTHGFRYEREYEVLSELTALLVDVKDATVQLRPTMDFQDSSYEEVIKGRLEKFFKTLKDIYQCSEKKRPFYPDAIYQAVMAVRKIAITEAVKYRHQNRLNSGDFMKYWEEAEKNQEEIVSLAETALEMIRERVTKWESLE